MNQLKLLASIFLITTLTSVTGCGHSTGSGSSFKEAQQLFNRENYSASVSKYKEIMKEDPASGDRALFEIGMIYAHSRNPQRNDQEAANQFQRVVSEYPESDYRQSSEMMVFYLNNIAARDDLIMVQQARVEALQQEVRNKESEVSSLKQRIGALEKNVLGLAMQNRSVDRIVVYKKDRRLLLFSKGELIKTYKVALGGNAVGPKEREGDKKTPEGAYVIDSRNRDSRYHLSLHISYPNEQDKKRAKELGVSPGGDITIHGIKSGYSWVGPLHTEADWTQGCIAVTDEEIEEIDRLVPDGTAIEILP